MNIPKLVSLLSLILIISGHIQAQEKIDADYFERAVKFYEAGQFSKAVDAFKEAIKQNNDNAEAYYYLGNSYFMMSRNKDAVRAYKQAVELKPDHFLAYNNLGTAYHRLGDFKGAVEAYKQAIGIKSDYPEAIFSLGVSYLELKDQDAAMEQHKRLAAIDEERADKLYNLIKNKISLQVLNGKAISLPKPLYPAQARAAHASGVVIVWVQIDETGKVVSASTVTGHILLRLAAIEAAKLARFTPTTLDGQPVKVSGLITYNFVLEEPGRQYLPPN